MLEYKFGVFPEDWELLFLGLICFHRLIFEKSLTGNLLIKLRQGIDSYFDANKIFWWFSRIQREIFDMILIFIRTNYKTDNLDKSY